MNAWLRNHYQSDTLPPVDVLVTSYRSAQSVLHNPVRYPNADRATLTRLVEEMEADAEICNILAEAGV